MLADKEIKLQLPESDFNRDLTDISDLFAPKSAHIKLHGQAIDLKTYTSSL